MNIKMINEAFKAKFNGVLKEGSESPLADELRAALDDTAFRLSMQQVANLKSYEIAFQDTIEQLFPDKAWWEVTGCNIFMDLFEHRDIDHTINEIVSNLKVTDVVEELSEEDTDDTDKETLIEEPIYDLAPQHDARKSFYNKAKVYTGDGNDKNRLYSYNTLVAEMIDGKPVVYGTYSATTLRHIKEWLKQLGYKAENAKQIMQDYGAADKSLSESRFDDMEPEVWDTGDLNNEYSDAFSYRPYDNSHNEVADRIRRKGYITSQSHSDHMTPLDLGSNATKSSVSKKSRRK